MTIKKQTISGVKWTSFSSIILVIVGVLKMSILTRYLDVEDFGLMAIVMLVLGFMNLFMDMGLTSAILHKQEISNKEYSSLYWLNIVFSIVLFFFIILCSPLIASFYKQPQLTSLIPLMSISILFAGLGNQFKTIEQKKLNFKFISKIDILSSFLSLILAVFLAVKGYGVYALVYSALVQFGGANFIYFIKGLIEKRINFYFNGSKTIPFMKIGFFQSGGQVVNYFNRDIDILLVGKFFSAEVLGGYSLAKQLAIKPMFLLNPIISRVGSPVLAKIQENKKQLASKYLTLVKIVSTFSFTTCVLIVIFASQIITIMYGEKFLFIVTNFQIIAAYIYLRSVSSTIGSLVIATGKTYLEFYWNLLILFIMPISVFIACKYQIIEYVSIYMFFTMLFLVFISWKALISKLINVSALEYYKAFVPNYLQVYSLLKNIKK